MKLGTLIMGLSCDDVAFAAGESVNVEVVPSFDGPGGNFDMEGVLPVRIENLGSRDLGQVSHDPSEIVVVYVGESLTQATRRPSRGVVAVALKDGFGALERRFSRIPAMCAETGALSARLFDAFKNSMSVGRFAQHASEILGNPLIISNTDCRVLAYAGSFPEDLPEVIQSLIRGYVSPEANDQLNEDGVLQGLRMTHRAALSHNARTGSKWAVSIVYYKSIEMGRLDVLEEKRPITAVDIELIDFASYLVGILIAQSGEAGERAGTGSSVLSDMLGNRMATEEAMRAQLATTSAPLDETYVVAQCVGDESLTAADYRAFMPSLVSCIPARCIWTMTGDAFVILIPIGNGEHAAGYSDYNRASHFLLENTRLSECLDHNGMRLFVSEPFSQLMLLPIRFTQARGLVDAVDALDGKSAILLFWQYRFRVMANSVSSFDQVDMMFDKRVVAMYRYDRAHGTSYFDTAVVSVLYPGAPGVSADVLCVHRNTYFYRIGKIRELFDLDLKLGEDRLAISFTEHVMKGMSGLSDLY